MYLFKRASDGQWVFGENIHCEIPAGFLSVEPSADLKEIMIRNSDGSVRLNPTLVTSFLKENGDAYSDFAALKAGYAGFFFRSVGSINSVSGMIIPDTSTGLKLRIILRGSAICFDKELTATGFAGTQDVDWKEAGSFGSDV